MTTQTDTSVVDGITVHAIVFCPSVDDWKEG